jgi:hypothetical protein
MTLARLSQQDKQIADVENRLTTRWRETRL